MGALVDHFAQEVPRDFYDFDNTHYSYLSHH